MKNFYQLIQGDCLEVLPKLEDESVDLIITDPPWSIGKKEYDKGNKGLNLLQELSNDLFRILKIGGHMLIDSSFEQIFKVNNILKDCFLFRQPIILYCNNQIGHRSYVGWNHFRTILWYCKPRENGSPSPVVKRYRDVIEFTMISTKNQGWSYPNPKSVYSYSKLVEMFSKVNDVILDIFVGSGTTILACQETKRNCIGIEINPKYCEIVKKRCFGRQFLDREVEYKFEVFK